MMDSICFIVEELAGKVWGPVRAEEYPFDWYEATHYQKAVQRATAGVEATGRPHRVVQVSRYIHAAIGMAKEES